MDPTPSLDDADIEFLCVKKSNKASLNKDTPKSTCPQPPQGPSFKEPVEIIDLTEEESQAGSDISQFPTDLIEVKNEEFVEDMGFEIPGYDELPHASEGLSQANSVEDLSDTSTTELPSIANFSQRVSERSWNADSSQPVFTKSQIMMKDMSEEEACSESERLRNAYSSQPAFTNEQIMTEDISGVELCSLSERLSNADSSQPGFANEQIMPEDISEEEISSVSEGPLNANSSHPMMFLSEDNKRILDALEDSEFAEKELAHLGVRIYEQDSFEQQVIEHASKLYEQRHVSASKELRMVEEDIRTVKDRLDIINKKMAEIPSNPVQMTRSQARMLSMYKKEKQNKLHHLKKVEAKRRSLNVSLGSTQVAATSSQMEPMESEEDRLIRLGEITPFGTYYSDLTIPEENIPTISMPENTDFDRFLQDEAESHSKKNAAKAVKKHKAPLSEATRIIVKNNLTDFQFTELKAVSSNRTRKQFLRIQKDSKKGLPSKKFNESKALVKNYLSDSEVSCEDETDVSQYSDEDTYVPEINTTDDEEYNDDERPRGKRRTKIKENLTGEGDSVSASESMQDLEHGINKGKGKGKRIMKKVVDDGNSKSFSDRLKKYDAAELQRKYSLIMESENGIVDSDDEVTELDEGFKVPNSVWNKLFNYQKTCVRWLWELHQQNCGGIIADDMGLGKTIQVIAFLTGLKFSNLKTTGDIFSGLGPALLVCPATVMYQWVAEFHKWWPPFRVAILHSSGSFVGNAATLINSICKTCGILLTTYEGLGIHQNFLLAKEWHYIILDEGHRIRNPNAKATIVAKSFRTCHRLALTGTPIQNNLKELWTLFDFIFPGKLGTLPVFMQQFAVPITQGGYANASQIQVETAYRCAMVLKEAIKPYLIRRTKDDVKKNINLPNKSDQVLLCEMTDYQISLYKEYLNSKEVGCILNWKLKPFKGLMNLRKICNHPDLFDSGPKIFADTDVSLLKEEEKFGFHERSGKMIVVEALLKEWKKKEHKVLLFTQSKQMMYILGMFIKRQGYSFLKMNGDTPISSRQPLITKFNSDTSIFLFLLTTKVGGIGVNLTGADRVIIFDPDWNPSTDTQAKERAWRIGQNKQVTIYRLVSLGTIEEKMYHRQIFKQFMTNRVLKNPAQQRFFKSNDLFELFQYKELGKQGTETSAIFAGTGSEVRPKQNLKRKRSSLETAKVVLVNGTVSFSDEKKEEMKQMAKKIAMGLSKNGLGVKNGATKQLDHQLSDIEDKALVDKTTLGKSVPNQKKGTVSVKDRKDGKTVKKSKIKKGTEVDGVKIDFVVKKCLNKHTQEEQEEKNNIKEDDYILSKLFKKSGVHTAMKHDTIVNSSTSDHTIVEGEAQRAANEAVRKLKESRKFCYRAEAGKPTDTGRQIKRQRFGQKNRPLPNSLHTESNTASKSTKLKHWGQKEGGAWSSSDLLAAIHKRKGTSGTDQDPSPSQTRPATKNDLLLLDLRNFIALQDGKATTKEIMAEFKEKVPDKKSPIFRALLNKMCNPSNLRSGDRLWELKEEFR